VFRDGVLYRFTGYIANSVNIVGSMHVNQTAYTAVIAVVKLFAIQAMHIRQHTLQTEHFRYDAELSTVHFSVLRPNFYGLTLVSGHVALTLVLALRAALTSFLSSPSNSRPDKYC